MCEISKWPWFSYVFHSKFIGHTDQNFQMKFHTNDTNRPSYLCDWAWIQAGRQTSIFCSSNTVCCCRNTVMFLLTIDIPWLTQLGEVSFELGWDLCSTLVITLVSSLSYNRNRSRLYQMLTSTICLHGLPWSVSNQSASQWTRDVKITTFSNKAMSQHRFHVSGRYFHVQVSAGLKTALFVTDCLVACPHATLAWWIHGHVYGRNISRYCHLWRPEHIREWLCRNNVLIALLIKWVR